MRSIVSSIPAGPTLQFTPITVAPSASAAARRLGGAPSSVLPSSSVVTCATMGRSDRLRGADDRGDLVDVVERLEHEELHAAFEQTGHLLRKYSSASSTPVLPHGSMRMPSGPMAPATKACSRAAWRAISLPAR